jgi:hypothetical protein
MAGSFSDYLELKVLDHITKVASFTAPTTLYFGLWTAALTDASNGGTAGEVTGGSYDRVAVTSSGTNWNTAAAGATDNKVDISYVTPTANWGLVTHVGAFDGNAKTSGDNLIWWSDLTISKTINNGDSPVKFAIGAFDVTLS